MAVPAYNSPVPPRSSPSHTPIKPRLRLPRNVTFDWSLPPSHVIVPEFPSFKATFHHWSALLERRDLDASEWTSELTDYDDFPELEGKDDAHSFCEELRMRWNARTMHEGAFEHYRRVTSKYTPQKRIENWVSKQRDVREYDDTVTPIKARIRLSPEVRKALAAQQASSQRPRMHRKLSLGKDKGKEENTKLSSSRGKTGLKAGVVDVTLPRTRSSTRKVLHQEMKAAIVPMPVLKPVTKSKGKQNELLKVPVASIANNRITQKRKREILDLTLDLEVQDDAPRQVKKARVVREILGNLDGGRVRVAREQAKKAPKVAVKEGKKLTAPMKKPTVQPVARVVSALPSPLVAPSSTTAVPPTGKYNTRRAAAHQASASTVVPASKGSANVKLQLASTRVGVASRLRFAASQPAPAETIDLRCAGCKHLFSTRAGLKRHKEGGRAKEACRA